MNLNKVILAGNLTRSPELRFTPNGTAVANFGMATNRAWTDERGDRQEAVEFHNIVVYGNQAEPCAQYLVKGQKVLVEGRITYRSWDDQDGVKHYRTEIIANLVQFGQKPQGAATIAEPNGEPRDEATTPADTDPSDDIPF